MEQLLKENIYSIVRSEFPASEIILFGSRARNTENENSDYDLLIIIEKNLSPLEKLPYRTKIRKELLKLGIFSDIVIQSKEELLIKQNLPGHIVRNALMEGHKL